MSVAMCMFKESYLKHSFLTRTNALVSLAYLFKVAFIEVLILMQY